MSRASPPGPPPFWLWKLTRASAIAAELGRQRPLEFGAGLLAVLLEDDVEVPDADDDALEHVLDVGILLDDRRDCDRRPPRSARASSRAAVSR